MPTMLITVGAVTLSSVISVTKKDTSYYGTGSFQIEVNDPNKTYYPESGAGCLPTGSEVIIYMDPTNPPVISKKVFSGYLESKTLSNDNDRVLVLRGRDYTGRLMAKMVPAASSSSDEVVYTDKTFDYIMGNLISTYAPEFTYASAGDGTVMSQTFTRTTVYNAVRKLCDELDYYFYIDGSKVLRVVKRTSPATSTDTLVAGTNIFSLKEETNSQQKITAVYVTGGLATLTATNELLTEVSGSGGIWYEFPSAKSPPLRPLTSLTHNATTKYEGQDFDVDYVGNPKGTPAIPPSVRIREGLQTAGATVRATYKYQKRVKGSYDSLATPRLEMKLEIPNILTDTDATAYATAYYNIYSGALKFFVCKSKVLVNTIPTNNIAVTSPFYGYSAQNLQVQEITHNWGSGGMYSETKIIDRRPELYAALGAVEERVRAYENMILREAESTNVSQLYGNAALRDFVGGGLDQWKSKYSPPLYIAPSNENIYGVAVTPLRVGNTFSGNVAWFAAMNASHLDPLATNVVTIATPLGYIGAANALGIQYLGQTSAGMAQKIYYEGISDALHIDYQNTAATYSGLHIDYFGNAVGGGGTQAIKVVCQNEHSRGLTVSSPTSPASDWYGVGISMDTGSSSQGYGVYVTNYNYTGSSTAACYYGIASAGNLFSGVYYGTADALRIFLTPSGTGGTGLNIQMSASVDFAYGVRMLCSNSTNLYYLFYGTAYGGRIFYGAYHGNQSDSYAVELDLFNTRSKGISINSTGVPNYLWRGIQINADIRDGVGIYVYSSQALTTSTAYGILVQVPSGSATGLAIAAYGRPIYGGGGIVTSHSSIFPTGGVYNGQLHVDPSTNRLYVLVSGVWRYVNLT